MRGYLTLVRRDLGSFFVSITGYMIIAMVTLLLGASFVVLVEGLNQESTNLPLTELFYSTFYFWLILLLAAPVITMRSFALEKASGTYETLMTAPVSDWQVVLAKFTSALLFYLLMWLPLIVCMVVLNQFSAEIPPVHVGQLLTTFLGILLLGALYLSLGCFASSLTRSQILAAMLTIMLGIGLFLVSYLSLTLPFESGWRGELMSHISMIEHMQEFVRGVIDTRHLVFYITVTAFFLFLTLKVVESRRWK